MPVLGLTSVPPIGPRRKVNAFKPDRWQDEHREPRDLAAALRHSAAPSRKPALPVSRRAPRVDFAATPGFYRVGGIRKLTVRLADVIGEDGVWYTTSRPRPGQPMMNGASDKIDSSRRVPRSRRRNNKNGRKGRTQVVR